MAYLGKMILNSNEAERILENNRDISLGEDPKIGPFVYLDASGGAIDIGDRVVLEIGAVIRTKALKKVSANKKGEPVYDYKTGPITIGDDCVIGAYSVVEPGSVIKDRTRLVPYTRYGWALEEKKAKKMKEDEQEDSNT